jgi:cold shock CspA family protein
MMAVAGDDGEKMTGTCKWFDSVKGFGFIEVDGAEQDYFVHQSDIYAPGYLSLAEGETVEFTVTTDERTGKAKAVDVTGPGGEYVQGTPPPSYDDNYDDGY